MYLRNYGGDENSRMVCIPLDDNEEDIAEVDSQYLRPKTFDNEEVIAKADPQYLKQIPFDMDDLPEEFLDEFEAPSFYDLPPNDSFEEVRCLMATPPPPLKPMAPTAAEKLESFRAEVAEVIELDDLRKRMAAHIGTSADDEIVEIDDVRRRMAAVIGESKPEPPLCPYKIPPLPEDPHAIPPPPKDPKDVVAIIRRAQAIARLKAIEEAKKTHKAPSRASTRRGLSAPAATSKIIPSTSKPSSKAVKPTKSSKLGQPKKTGLVRKKDKQAEATPQHPPDYVPDEWAAAILRTRKLAGLKTTNPKLLPKTKTPVTAPSPVMAKPHLTPPAPKTPQLPTLTNIIERVAAIRSKTQSAKSVLEDRIAKHLNPINQDDLEELDEYETLEQLYGGTKPDQYAVMQENVTHLKNRINALQQQLLQTPPALERSRRATTPIEQEELDEFEALEELYGAESHEQCLITDDMQKDFQTRIDTLQRKLLESPIPIDTSKRSPIYEIPSILRYQNLLENREAMAAAAAQVGLMKTPEYNTEDDYDMTHSSLMGTPVTQRTFSRTTSKQGTPKASPKTTPKTITPKRSRSPISMAQVSPSGFDDAFLQNIDMPDFDVGDVPEFAFSAEALADAGFVIGDDVSLGEISMPDFDEDISLVELGLEDVTSPDLCDLSISGTDLALEPDYPLEITTEEEEDIEAVEQIIEEETQKPGFLTSMVNAVVDRFKNIFSPSKTQEGESEDELNLDTSLPNMFESTPPPKPETPPKESTPVKLVEKKPITPEDLIIIPPHPKDPKDYMAIVKRAQAIQKKKAQEAALAPLPLPLDRDKKGKREIKSSIPKRAPPPKKKVPVQKQKKGEKPTKVYPPGEYSPSDVKAVARARSLAGIKSRSVLLNPERAARIAERKAAREAEIAAIEALPTVERMRKKMEVMRKKVGGALPRPSIEALGALEAIRASLPIPKPTQPKWRPTGRLRSDRHVKESERVFTSDFGRVLIPSRKTQKKKGWKELDVMSPIVEETSLRDNDFIKFSPLKAYEGQKRLQHLQEQAARRAAETIRAAEEAQAAISFQTPPRYRSQSLDRTPGTPQMEIGQYSPIQLQSPSSPRTEETRREKVTTKIGPNGGAETIKEELTETSIIKNGEVHTSTRQVTTKTDEYGNVTYHIQEGEGLTGEQEAYHEDLANIEPPDFLDTSDIPPPRDPSIPTPAEIIDRIRSTVQQKLNFALPDISQSPTPESPGQIDFPQDLTDEDLFEMESPEFVKTPPRVSPQVKPYTPIEKDQRMYAWGEMPKPTPPPRISPPRMPTPKSVTPPPKPISPPLKNKTSQGVICIPPHPKDPKDYIAMVKRAQAIQRLKKQEEDILSKIAPALPKITGKKGRIPISRWVAPPPKDPKRPARKRLVLKKRLPKVSPKQKIVPPSEEEDDDIGECPSEPPPLSQEYRDAVARARLIHGLKNRTAALNPKVAAKLAAKKAADEADQAAYDALPHHEKIKKRMENLRKIPAKKRRIEPSADILGTIAAIRANMPPIEEVLRQPSPRSTLVSPRTPQAAYLPISMIQAPIRGRPRSPTPSPITDKSLEEFEFMEQLVDKEPLFSKECPPVKEFLNESLKLQDISRHMSPGQEIIVSQKRTASPENAPVCVPIDISLEDFEKLEAELEDLSLDEFETLEAQAQKLYDYRTPKRGERHGGRQLFTPSATSEKSDIKLSIKQSFIKPRDDDKPGSIYYDEMQDFRVPTENIVLETSQLMPETPRNLQERFKRLKEAHEKRSTTPTYLHQLDQAPATPTAIYSPITLMSPSGKRCVLPGQYKEQSSPISIAPERDWLIDIDGTPEKRFAAVRQFRDLEDMPFDELEYELEPSLANISFEKPITPPPRPSEIVRKMRSQVQQQLKERAELEAPIELKMLQLPEELTDEELHELSVPSFAKTPPRTPPVKYKSPRVSLPMAWGEVRPATPVTPPTPLRIPTPIKVTSPRTIGEVEEIKEKLPTPEGPIIIPPHPKDPKDYAAMVRRAQAIYKLKKQEEADEAARAFLPPPQTVKKGRVPISRWVGPPPKKVSAKPRRKLVMRKRLPQSISQKKEIEIQPDEEEGECPAEPPPLSQEYRDAVARARLLHGLKNRTAALNPKIAAKIAAKKAAEEAAEAAFQALPEHEKIKVRMERLRKKPRHRRGVKPTMEQIAYIEALKQVGEYQYPPTPIPQPEFSPPKVRRSPRLSIIPQAESRHISDNEELAEFEALEQYHAPRSSPTVKQDKLALKQRIADLEEQLLEAEGLPQITDISLAEFEDLEAQVAPPDHALAKSVTALDMKRLISDLQQQQLVTPPRIDPREKYRQLLAQRKSPQSSPVLSPVKTPEIHYSPITFPATPSREAKKRAEKSTTQITRSGNDIIKEQVVETSEIVDGELQHFTTHVTTTTDPQGNVTCEINESKRITAKDRSDEIEIAEELGDIEEPSFLDTTPVTPMERPRPRDLIEKVRKQMKDTYQPEVPTGHLIELRTPPPMLPLPEKVTDEELLDYSYPELEATPLQTPIRTPIRSPFKSPDISIPQLFIATPPPPTPPLPPVSPLRYRIPSPEGPIVIPAHPEDPTDYKAMVRRARKIQQLMEQNEAEIRADEEAKTLAAAAEAAKPKKKERVPISRWTAPPPKKSGKRKKLVMRKRGEALVTKTPAKPSKLEQIPQILEEEIDYSKPPPLPENYAAEIAKARILAGLKNRTAALNPKVAAREAAKAEAIRKAQKAEAARLALLNAPPPSPIRDYATAIERMKKMKEKGERPRGQPSMASAAYLDALKSAMLIQQPLLTTEVTEYETPKTRYQKLMAERTIVPPVIEESPIKTPAHEDIIYSPLRFVSPRLEEDKYDFVEPLKIKDYDMVTAFESLDEIEELVEFEEPSFIDVSQYPLSEDQYEPLTPPPQPSDIIKRLRKQYEQQQAAIYPNPLATPTALEFPEELPEEELFEISAPSFAKSPIKSETPANSPNVSIPHYFAETPKVVTPKPDSPKIPKSPTAEVATDEIELGSPPLLGICPGIKVKTPQGPIAIPPHPKDPTDVAAMIRRAQLIQKLKAKEVTEQADIVKAAKTRVPISRRIVPSLMPKKGKETRRLVLKKKAPSPRECPTEPPELPDDYIAEVAKARRLAGLKNKTALLNPKVAARQQAQLAATKTTTPLPKPTPPPPDYGTIMNRIAALRAAKAKAQQGPTTRELTTRQHLINRQQRKERKRLLAQLERIRQEQGFDKSIEFEDMKTPPPVKERFQAIKSRLETKTPTSLYPYSPVKTPDAADLPQYQPLVLPPSPPYQFLDNVCIPDIGDISMKFEDLNNYDLDEDDLANLEFQMAEEAAAAEHFAMDENNNFVERQAELETDQDFDIAKRIEKLQQQLLQSPDRTNINTIEEYNMAERMERLRQQLLKTPNESDINAMEEDNINERMENLQQQFLYSPTKKQSKSYVCVDMSQFNEGTQETEQQDIYDEMMDDFEDMEREYS